MAIKRADIRSILENESMDNEAKAKALLDIVHGETDVLRDQYDDIKSQLASEKTAKEAAETAKNDVQSAFDTYKTEQEVRLTEANQALNDYKASVASEAAMAQKKSLYRNLLKKAGVSEKRLDTVMRVSDLSKIEVEEGKIKDEDSAIKTVKTDWSDFIVKQSSAGANVDNPPNDNGGNTTITKERFAKMGYVARAELRKTDPDTYKTLSGK